MVRRRARANGRNAQQATPAGDEVAPHVAAHLRLLGLASVAAYQAWCRQHGFVPHTAKTAVALRREREQARMQQIRAEQAQRRRTRDPLRLLEAALDGDAVTAGDADPLRQAVAAVHRAASLSCREDVRALLRAVHEHASFLLDHDSIGGRRVPYVTALVALAQRRGQWLRPLDEWRPRSHNVQKQFASLARHRLAEYPVPRFLDSAWLRRDRGSHRWRDLFAHVGRGGNPRTAKLPVALTKKVAHWFLQAPGHYSIEGAIRWGQVHALGGSARLADAIVATPLGTSFANDDFWQTVVRFSVANPMLDCAHVGPIVDHIEHAKFRPTEVALPDGTIAERPPPQPGFSMSRRTPDALLRQMERWHANLGRGGRAGSAVGPETWPASGIPEFRWETGHKNKQIWTIRELRSRQALRLEGEAMRHCVTSYARSCAAGRCSIWALELTTKDGLEKRQTVEVSRQRVIVQSRGRGNVLPEERDLAVLRRWAEQANLGLVALT